MGKDEAMNSTLVTRHEAARALRVSNRTIARYEQAGRLNPVRLSSRCIRYRSDEVESLIDSSVTHRTSTSKKSYTS
jgi:predicted site-specific integrase-resolvase